MSLTRLRHAQNTPESDLVGETFQAGLKQVSDKIDVMEFGLNKDVYKLNINTYF